MIIAPVAHESEGTTHFIAIKQDITERRQIEQQLLRAQRMEGIGLLAGGIAHDLNNVLAPILLSVELLRLRKTDPADLRALDVIGAAARRATGVVRQVLTFARGIDGERIPLRPRDLLRELAMMIEETFPRPIEILRDVADDTPMVCGDATQLHQVLLNLAVNARDAMPQGGRLVFSARGEELRTRRPSYMGEIPPGAYVLFSVRDTGEGMSDEVRERIFEPFFTTKPRGKGTGLGLPTVLGIVRSHRGFLQVDSQPGVGSEFRIYLPAMAPEQAGSNPPIPLVRVEGRGRCVLVCDDEVAVREVAGVVLKQAGFRVIEASHGREALEVFTNRGDEVDAVLMDLMMPLMTGDRAAVEMLRARPALPLVLMSGLMDQETVHTALKSIGDQPPALLRKPFTAQDLLTALAKSSAATAV
jgi:nitrogen-specific signal transduction histidine kinase/ActR/RegA family two-component response regulator